jgi:hypothetical protein
VNSAGSGFSGAVPFIPLRAVRSASCAANSFCMVPSVPYNRIVPVLLSSPGSWSAQPASTTAVATVAAIATRRRYECMRSTSPDLMTDPPFGTISATGFDG